MKTCQICDQDLVIRWTDLHGFAVCIQCGCPYQVYHYDENNKRIEKPIQSQVLPEYVAGLRDFWQKNKTNVCPGVYMINQSSDEAWQIHAVAEHLRLFNARKPEPRQALKDMPLDCFDYGRGCGPAPEVC